MVFEFVDGWWNDPYPAFPVFCIIYRGGGNHLYQYEKKKKNVLTALHLISTGYEPGFRLNQLSLSFLGLNKENTNHLQEIGLHSLHGL